ncbi:MAG TPA: F0F1 ATP synthase subunit B [Candidatus Angelobacter sp.]|nr:F0F1 ATP synthase subunit B [Candidatus Angelobacter sp.]
MLNFSLGDILFQLVVFLILMLIVSKLAARPVLDMMKKRQDHIDEQLKSAEESQRQAQALLEEQRAELKKTREEASQIIESEKKRAEQQANEIVNLAKERAERLIDDAKEDIETERVKAVASLRDEVAHLSLLLATKVLEKEVDKKAHEKAINDFVKQVGERL